MIHKFFDDSNYSLYLCTVILNSRISFISFKWGQYVLFCSSRWNMINLTAMKAFPIFSIRNWGLNLIFSNSYFLFLPTEHKQYIIGLIGRKMPQWLQWEESSTKWHIVWILELALFMCSVPDGSQSALIISLLQMLCPSVV